jgi:hypothetical protein
VATAGRRQPRPCRRRQAATAAFAFATSWLATSWIAAATCHAGTEASPAEITALVESLGADDYAQREAAAARLNAIGAAAVDPLLTAAETNGDLEVALRARWLVDAIPIDAPHDAPAVAKLLENFKRKDFGERVQVMHRLLRADDDEGIEPLARIVRLDRSVLGSRVSAALLAREWQPGDPVWSSIRDRIATGIGGSSRPAARFLRAVVRFSAADTADARAIELAEAAQSLALLTPAAAADGDPANAAIDAGDSGIAQTTLRIFQRSRLQMLLAAGRRDEALAATDEMFNPPSVTPMDVDTVGEETAATLVWLVERGLPEAVDRLRTLKPSLIGDDPLVGYAAAIAEKARHRDAEADTLAAAAFAKPAGTNAEFVDRVQTAILLAKWGAAEWATREYTALLDDQRAPPAQFTLAAIMFAEFLHDQEREDEAAACLRKLMEGRVAAAIARGGNQIMQQIGRDPQTIRSRMHYFDACAAAVRGDTVAQRKALEDALRASSKDVDALIGLYGLGDNTPEQRADAVARIRKALEQIEAEIQSVPEDANSYNEYAWLVANTEGDVQKAVRYSKHSLVKSFDSSSYLDTLAHCQAAAGNIPAAIRTQSLALRQEPHNRTIRRNLARFESR